MFHDRECFLGRVDEVFLDERVMVVELGSQFGFDDIPDDFLFFFFTRKLFFFGNREQISLHLNFQHCLRLL